MFNNVIIGTVEGTGSALNVSMGFQPSYVHLMNIDGNAELHQVLAEAKAQKRTAATFSNPTSNIISAFTGSSTAGEGFTIGADADINVSGETIKYVAVR